MRFMYPSTDFDGFAPRLVTIFYLFVIVVVAVALLMRYMVPYMYRKHCEEPLQRGFIKLHRMHNYEVLDL